MIPQTSMFPRQQLHWNRGTVFSTRSVPRCYKHNKLGVSVFSGESVGGQVSELENCWCCRCELLLSAMARASSGTQRKRNVRRWRPLPSNGREDVTVDTSMCVIVKCKEQSRAVSKSPINPVISPKPVNSHTRIVTIYILSWLFNDAGSNKTI
jgi:hypothetical protein